MDFVVVDEFDDLFCWDVGVQCIDIVDWKLFVFFDFVVCLWCLVWVDFCEEYVMDFCEFGELY